MLKMKYTWAAVLVALCLTVACSAAFAQDWAVDDASLPSDMVMGDEEGSSVTAENLSATDVWNAAEAEESTDYALVSVTGVTGFASELADPGRWGLTQVLIEEVSVAEEETYEFGFDVVAPPWITLVYSGSVGPTDPPSDATFDCNWMMKELGVSLMVDDTAAADVTISTFPDVGSGVWARPQIEECANRVPMIVQGYGDGEYKPKWTVTRGAMAMFVSRAQVYDVARDDDGASTLTDPPFPDVPADFWSGPEIQACVDDGVVQGYDDGLYRPGVNVDRAQMAAYIGRAAGFTLPTVTADVFDDVAADHWAASEIKACVDNDVVLGYEDGLYQPTWLVGRDQMAVFVYRGLMRPTDTSVVLAGPAITAADVGGASGITNPGAATFYGWTSSDLPDAADAGYAYLALDAVAVGTGSVTFTLWEADADREGNPEADPPVPPDTPVGTSTVTLTSGVVTAAQAAVDSSGGNPYLVIWYDLPTLTADTDYALAINVVVGSYDNDLAEVEFTTAE